MHVLQAEQKMKDKYSSLTPEQRVKWNQGGSMAGVENKAYNDYSKNNVGGTGGGIAAPTDTTGGVVKPGDATQDGEDVTTETATTGNGRPQPTNEQLAREKAAREKALLNQK